MKHVYVGYEYWYENKELMKAFKTEKAAKAWVAREPLRAYEQVPMQKKKVKK
jgi:hypothetical protein